MFHLSELLPFTMPIWLEVVGGFVLGAIFGSYFATLLWRWPLRLSANKGRSHCDACSRPLTALELIPLAGWLIHRRRCRTCGTRIDATHFAIELSCALFAAYCFARGMVLLAPFGWLLIILAVFDARYLWLPDPLVAGLAVMAFVAPVLPQLTREEQLLGGAVGFGTLWLVARTYRLLRGRAGLGGGDAKLLGAIGLSVGALQLPTIVLVASAVGLADAAWRIARGQDREAIKLPLGTYLCGTTILAVMLVPWWSG